MFDITRRSFLELSTAAATGAVAGSQPLVADDNEVEGPGTREDRKWFKTAYRRAVIDMHISDWDDKFLSEFDPDEYASMLVKSRAQSIVCYCQSHVGLFNYPTRVGQQHAAFKGRNVLQETIDACHRHEIAVVLYTSLIFDRWAADNHPDWRMRTWDGKIQGEGGRHGVMCVNSPYREYVKRFVQEICGDFDFEGIRFDMTFWPWLCYCEHCQKRFDEEVGGELPTTVNWLDEKWVAFQRCRERWLVEFAKLATGTVRRLKPNATVEHQSSTYPLNWMFGVTEALASQNDFLQGDFYGDSLQGSFVRKLLEELTPSRPFGYETSFSVTLKDHTAMKSEALLEAKAAAAISDSAAFIFIDAIDPIGTVNPKVHDRMGRVFDRLMAYYPHLGGERVRDIAVFYSLESKFNFSANDRPVGQPDTSDAHTESSMQAARRAISGHLPLGVITKQSLAKLPELKVLILSNVNMMDQEECDAIRQWVWDGGTIFASGGTSLVNKRGQQQQDFMLADVFGVSLSKANWEHRPHYIAPTAEGQSLFPDFDAKYPAFTTGYGFEVKPHSGAEVLATTTLPWPRSDAEHFSSIHSNPPWQRTDHPEIVSNRFGKGKAVYCSSLIENLDGLQETFLKLLRLLNENYTYEAEAPASVEMTMFHQPNRDRYVVSLVNFQKDMPNIPVDGIKIRMRLDRQIKSVLLLPDNRPIKFGDHHGVVSFHAPRLETLAMFAVEVM